MSLAVCPWAALLAINGCDQPTGTVSDRADRPTTPSYSLVNERGDEAICGGSGATNASSNGIDRTCLTQGNIGLNLDLAPTIPESYVEGAMQSWNHYLHEITSMPLLVKDTSGGIPFNVHGYSSSDQYCGVTPTGSGGHVLRVDIWPASAHNCDTYGTGPLKGIIVHEMAHVLGWNGGHGGSPGSANSYTVGCATFLNIGTVPLSNSACHHDVEALFRARLNTSGWVFSVAYVTQPILWTTDAPGFASVADGGTSQVSISHWLGTTGSSLSRGNSSVDWVSGNSSRFTVSSTGLLTGQSSGSAKLYLKAGGTASGYTIWTPFTVNGDSLTVQVTPSPYAVTSDQTPITTEGYHTFTSNVGDPGTSRVWAVDDSRTTQIDPDTIFSTSGNIATLWVEAGSYTFRFHVFDDYQDIPVCTGSGDQYTAQHSSPEQSPGAREKAPGPVPNVVEGCLPGQGGGDQ